MKLNDINLRDPYILPFNGKYYLYGSRGFHHTGFDVYVSEDLENWCGPKSIFEYYEGFWGVTDFWSPEVYVYNDKFVMFASFKGKNCCRGTQALIADSPEGPFTPLGNGALTPKDWECLDGTLYIEDGEPYMVFCHEWAQIVNGTVCRIKLSKDLKERISEPEVLWSAKEAYCFNDSDEQRFVTDGPFLLKIEDELICIWSTLCNGSYMELISRSDNGRIDGKWSIDNKALFTEDGGHGMIFKSFYGKYKFTYHSPNKKEEERPCIDDIILWDLKENNKK